MRRWGVRDGEPKKPDDVQDGSEEGARDERGSRLRGRSGEKMHGVGQLFGERYGDLRSSLFLSLYIFKMRANLLI